ncbi:hypothetical protein [Futiania mangrovi]|uniref:Uncharacterized protein n=1 Tax=Futiania mangrovi TaxID=2959716 RepID=A0A9J6P8H6_9PROT|nr:hypothetical protein [Futiania mangrovii]MCP1334853.1 hypothetical protein [Futiania mangrovii]
MFLTGWAGSAAGAWAAVGLVVTGLLSAAVVGLVLTGPLEAAHGGVEQDAAGVPAAASSDPWSHFE